MGSRTRTSRARASLRLLAAVACLLLFASLLNYPAALSAEAQQSTYPPGAPTPPPPPPIPTNTPTPVVIFPASTPTPTPVIILAPPPTATATPTPTPATPPFPGAVFHIKGVRVEKANSKPDWKLRVPSIKRLNIGTLVRLSIYVKVSSVVSKAHILVRGTVRRNGQVVYQAGLSEDRSAPGGIWDHWNYTPAQPGSYTFTGRVQTGQRTQIARVAFTAVQPQRPSFNFNSLKTYNVGGQPATSFARTEPVVLVATITVQHAAGPVAVSVGQTLQIPTPSGWKTLGRRVQNAFVTTNGTHPYTVSFYPQSAYSRLRMVIDVTVGHQTQTKAVVFSVRG